MASKSTLICFALGVFLIMCIKDAKAQSGCSSSLMGLAPCLSYVTGNSSAPSPTCCSQLASVVQSAPACLCSFTSGNSMGFAINQTLALALPQACNIQTPPVSQCDAGTNGPASSPAASPSPVPAASPESPSDDASNPNTATQTPATTTPTLPGGSSKTTPTGTNDGNLKKPAFYLFFVAMGSILASF
ncbi:OLC1v1007249C1 [Oldenlandia corymbosa var. corymbosa]|uniref:OLC1v1007249C1 n=1 Tax=Oldenlandia corymbosa var. corymbosa TaxID=529605 RepID=A0AAV1DLL9_OLDCO|nr:OLC1v1007249C1 [Oldenlandia corymbosa var. corymbosa]